jgi:hypothetical protein
MSLDIPFYRTTYKTRVALEVIVRNDKESILDSERTGDKSVDDSLPKRLNKWASAEGVFQSIFLRSGTRHPSRDCNIAPAVLIGPLLV